MTFFQKLVSSFEKNNILNFTLLFSIICIVFWSFHELSILGADFGIYYIQSKYVSSDFRLYSEIFDHKGPLYFYFLKTIGQLIGWGQYKAIISLALTTLTFFVPIYFLIIKFIKSNIEKIFLILIATSLLIGQDASSSIAFFQEGLLIISLSKILFSDRNLLNFTLIIIFFWLSFFTRIDSILFFPIIFIYLIDNIKNSSGILLKSILIIIFLISPILIFQYLSNYFDFSFKDYWIHNFEFNQWYSTKSVSDNFISDIQHFIFRPNGLILSSQTFILPYFLFLTFKKNKTIATFFQSIKSINIYGLNKVTYGFLITIISLLSYLFTKADNPHYILIFLCPSLIYLLKIFSLKSNNRNLIFSPVIFLLVSLNTSNLMTNFETVFRDLPIKVSYERTLNYIDENKIQSLEIIGGMGWPYIISDTRPVGSLVNFWMYKTENPFTTRGLLTQHKILLNQKPGYLFWIENGLLKYKNTNIYLKELLLNSEIVEDQGYYSMFKIR